MYINYWLQYNIFYQADTDNIKILKLAIFGQYWWLPISQSGISVLCVTMVKTLLFVAESYQKIKLLKIFNKWAHKGFFFWVLLGLEKFKEQHCTTLNHPTSFQHKGMSLVLYWARCTVELTQYLFCRINDWVSFGMWTFLQCRMQKRKRKK